MSKLKSFQLIMIVAVILGLLPVLGQTGTKKAGNVAGPDVIAIDLSKEMASNEMKPVKFFHAKHNQAVEGRCEQCHVRDKETLVFKFKRTDQPPTKELYHENCISCHAEKKAAGRESGPLAAECRSCHGALAEPPDTAWTKIPFSKSLHYIHESSEFIVSTAKGQTDNCSACHHNANEKSRQIYYTKGEESACVYCHKETKTQDVRSIRDASHDSCVACHEKLGSKKIKAGPVTCYGCHDVREQAKIEVVKTVPRLKRNQPDVALMTGLSSSGKNPKYLMNPVAFNHVGHETRAESCKVCHHESLKKCSDCHTPAGDVKGDFIRLEQAMHSVQSGQSCVGCHNQKTTASDCAGCHAMMPSTNLLDTSCAVCHNTPDNQVVADEKMKPVLAQKMVSSRAKTHETIDAEKIPEIVQISILADEYKPSEFPHRKVVQAITKRIEKSELANAFHKDQQALCMGCHHNSPRSMEPPRCASCHGKTSDAASGRPGLKAAYHGQCITCHQEMGIKEVLATDCIKCHAKK
ncbi:MAG: cytochrome c class III [Proteobacteria bacterium]|nr:cytochrome c class III [Pseudomonadota bacterium]MBU1386775.1 cytochrome c class III [Pseudomonadota bacterium]MBU1544719.1 cytochrome c class III [Pseudomonadota bacterium]MBU2481862.1 cytochrome c class III [Pseudomonadota bacterium]